MPDLTNPNEQPPEEGIHEEGPFDIGASLMDKLSEKIRGNEAEPSMLRKALAALPALAMIPMIPSKDSLHKGEEAVKAIIKKPIFRNITQQEVSKVVPKALSATKAALKGEMPSITKMRAENQINVLGAKVLSKEEIANLLSNANKAIGD